METKKREKLLLIGVAACVGIYLPIFLLVTPLSPVGAAAQTRIKDLRHHPEGRETLASAPISNRWNQMFTNTLSVNQTVRRSQLFKAFQGWAVSNPRHSRLPETPAQGSR